MSRSLLYLSRDGELWPTISASVLEPIVALDLLPRIATGFARILDLERTIALTDATLIQTVDQIRGNQPHTSLDTVKLGGKL